jgi:hypothetical protein
MSVIEIAESQSDLTLRQRWSHYLALLFAVLGILIGFNLRQNFTSASTQYVNPRAGLTARYPQNWLLEEGGRDFIFRVRDTSVRGFSTTIQVSVRAVSSATSPRNIFDALTLERAQVLAAYNVVSIEPFVLPDDTETQAMIYSFVSIQSDPFLQSLPIVVEGIDILLIERGQAIIVSFLSEASTFDANLPVLERFLRSLEL